MDVPWVLLQRVAVVVTLFAGGALALALDGREIGGRLRARFVLGLPWGTFVSVAFVLAVYLFVQGGLSHWYNPVVLPFRAWSYLYPLGVLTAGFSHAGPGHLLGNLFGTLALAPLVEYAWGHFPRERGTSAFGSLRTNPLVRAFVIFPLAVLVTGVVLAVFTIGPVIGFSGVVFAFAGFALVRYPLGTIVALSATNVFNLVYRALTNPVVEASGRAAYVTPWWAEIAIQGHAIGLVVGILLGVVFLQSRASERPPALRLWVGVLLFSVMQSMWAVYWFRSGGEFVLYRAVGASLVALLATLVTVGVSSSDRPLLSADAESPQDGDVLADGDTEEDTASTTFWTSDSMRTITGQQAGMVVLLLIAALLAGPAIPVNLVAAGDELPGESVTVGDYEMTYAEDVPNGMVSVVSLSAFGETTEVTTSGVIVRNEDRQIWTTAVSKGKLAFSGRERVIVGGVGWRDSVVAVREGWNAVGGGTVYTVTLVDDGDNYTVFTSPPATADPVIGGRNVSIEANGSTFYVVVASANATDRAPLPGVDEAVVVDDITFIRDGNRLIAVDGETRVAVFTKEAYN